MSKETHARFTNGLSPIEVAAKLKKIKQEKGFATTRALANFVGMHEVYVGLFLSLNKLCDKAKKLIKERGLTKKAGYALAKVTDHAVQGEFIDIILANNWSADEQERWIIAQAKIRGVSSIKERGVVRGPGNNREIPASLFAAAAQRTILLLELLPRELVAISADVPEDMAEDLLMQIEKADKALCELQDTIKIAAAKAQKSATLPTSDRLNAEITETSDLGKAVPHQRPPQKKPERMPAVHTSPATIKVVKEDPDAKKAADMLARLRDQSAIEKDPEGLPTKNLNAGAKRIANIIALGHRLGDEDAAAVAASRSTAIKRGRSERRSGPETPTLPERPRAAKDRPIMDIRFSGDEAFPAERGKDKIGLREKDPDVAAENNALDFENEARPEPQGHHAGGRHPRVVQKPRSATALSKKGDKKIFPLTTEYFSTEVMRDILDVIENAQCYLELWDKKYLPWLRDVKRGERKKEKPDHLPTREKAAALAARERKKAAALV